MEEYPVLRWAALYSQFSNHTIIIKISSHALRGSLHSLPQPYILKPVLH